jgi:uncharacterized protein DUF1326
MATETSWRMRGDAFEACSCNVTCPCNFGGDPTQGFCEAIVAWRIQEGNYGNTRLDHTWPCPSIHQWGIPPPRLNLASGRHPRRAIAPTCVKYKTQIWAMMLKQFHSNRLEGEMRLSVFVQLSGRVCGNMSTS